ncbi:MAG: inositol monophosphatase family protein [Bacteroidota bacterium]
MDLLPLSELAIQAALEAGKVIQEYMQREVAVEKKEGGASYASQVVTVVDKASEEVIMSHLLPSCETHDLALLSEETEDDGSRFEKAYFWCIDPLDGTLPFINKYPGFSVSIALVAQDGTPQIGVVFDPSTDTLYHAVKGQGAFKNQKVWKPQPQNHFLTYVTDRTLAETPRADEIQAFLDKKTAELGLTEIREKSGAGAVLNAIFVLENGPACMLKFPKKAQGGGSIWDYAATACFYQELGLPATNYEGGQLDLNKQEGSFMNHEGVFFGNWGREEHH